MKTILITTLLLLFATIAQSQTEWIKYDSNPILTCGPSNWDINNVAFSTIVFDGDSFKMWYSGGIYFTTVQIGLATSSDGLEWEKYSGNPVFTLGSPGSFDAGLVGCASVIFDEGIYKMWYIGSPTNVNDHWRIGYATSLNGIVWQRQNGGNPVLDIGSVGEWDDHRIGHPTVMRDGSLLKMWYHGARVPGSLGGSIGYATSIDGINWTKYNDPSTINPPFAESDPVLAGASGDWDAIIQHQPNVILNGSFFEMWYVAQGNLTGAHQEMGYASSMDGINWTKYNDPSTPNPPFTESDPVMHTGENGQFDDTYLLAPNVILGGDQIYRMWYTGYGESANKWRIGFAATDSSAVPVELESFSAVTIGSNINLNWVTATELNNYGFELFRNGNKIAFIEGGGTTTEKQEYSYMDRSLKDGIYNYRLEQIDFDGTRNIISNEITVYLSLPEKFSLEQNFPNPFNPSTVIGYQLSVSSDVTLIVYDLLGREVATLVDEYKPAGSYQIEFDASDFSSGVYLYKLTAGGFIQTKKLILMK